MDNSLKLLLAVLGIAGVLAFLAPTNLATPAPIAVATPVAPVVAPPVDTSSPTQMEPVSNSGPQEAFKFGEPTIDGKPYGGDINDGSSTNGRNSGDIPVVQAAPLQAGAPILQVAPPQPGMPVAPSEQSAPANTDSLN